MLGILYSIIIAVEASGILITIDHWLPALLPLDQQGIMMLVIFIVIAGVVYRFKPESDLMKRVIVHSIIVSLMMLALFKATIYDYRSILAWQALIVLSFIGIICQWAWDFLAMNGRLVWSIITDKRYEQAMKNVVDVLFIVLIVALIFVPDVQAVVARMFIGEQFHHIDNFLMGQTWTVISGGRVNVDTMSQYGVGTPVAMAFLSQFLGKFSYELVVTVVMWLIIIYYIGAYLFLRRWFQNIPLAMAALLAGFKVQMFYTLSYPCILTYPQSSIMRGFFDVAFFACVLGYLRQRHVLWLVGAICFAGISIWLVTATGVYLTLALGAIVFIEGIDVGKKRWITLKPFVVVLGSLLVAALLFWMCIRDVFFTSSFWKNMLDFIKIFTSGYYSGPLWGPMQYQQFWDLFIAFLWIATLLGSILIIGFRHLNGMAKREELLVIGLSIYGLGLLEHWITMTLGNNYYSKALPFVWVLFWWVRQYQQVLAPQWQRRLGLSILVIVGVALFTNHHLMSYPNLLNFSRNPMTDVKTVAQVLPTGYPYFFHKYRQWGEDRKLPVNNFGEQNEGILSEYDFQNDAALKRYYLAESDFRIDAQLIASKTGAHEKVPVLSSFEIALLMQANRKPFFYVFPFLENRPMRMRFFEVDQLFAQEHLDVILTQLRTENPNYIFMEKIFLNKDFPKRYYRDTPALLAVLDYVFAHYQVSEQGQYLVAMKRK